MANQVGTLVGTCPIQSPAEKFYNFFKYDMNKLLQVFPAAFTGVEIITGEEGTVGNVKLWTYVLGGITLTAEVLLEAVDDAAKSLIFSIQKGDVLELYKSFKCTLDVSDGLAKWTYAYEKATLLSPPPDLYIPLAITATTLVDAYLLLN